jgi:hypothetical protein
MKVLQCPVDEPGTVFIFMVWWTWLPIQGISDKLSQRDLIITFICICPDSSYTLQKGRT